MIKARLNDTMIIRNISNVNYFTRKLFWHLYQVSVVGNNNNNKKMSG